MILSSQHIRAISPVVSGQGNDFELAFGGYW